MLTSLDIKTPQYKSKIMKALSKLMFDTMRIVESSASGVTVKHIEYINRSGRVNFKKIDKEVKAQRNRLLCSQKLQLPEKSGYRRFCSKEYEYRLCTNLAIALLCSVDKKNLNVALVDFDASFTMLPKYLLKYTDSVVVVTNETDVYKEVCDNILDDIGAPIRLSKSMQSIYGCDLVVAPKGVSGFTQFTENSVVLTTEKSVCDTQATIVYSYQIELDEKFSGLCPECLSQTYFASALYSMCHKYELGEVVPHLCVSDNKVHTPLSLRVLMQNIADKTLT